MIRYLPQIISFIVSFIFYMFLFYIIKSEFFILLSFILLLINLVPICLLTYAHQYRLIKSLIPSLTSLILAILINAYWLGMI